MRTDEEVVTLADVLERLKPYRTLVIWSDTAFR